jgi:zinc-dependent metalloproteinase lipoprotein
MRKQILLVLLASSVFFGCKESEDTTNSKVNTYPLSDSTYTWNSNVNQQLLKITSSSSWSITSDVNWCDPLISSGTGTSSIPLWVSPNITSQARSGIITVTNNTTKYTIPISQPAYNSDTEYVYRVPVVFHILYKDANDSLQYIKNGWMARVLRVVNLYYKFNKTNIQFEMAKYDEDGNTLDEPGVMRQQVSFSSYDCDKFLGSEGKITADLKEFSKNAQNMKRYLNVYIYRFSDNNVMGISDIAVLPTAHKLDGCTNTDEVNNLTTLSFPFGSCINNKYIYETEDNGYYNPDYIVVTLAHELGHYIGLLHSFSEDECNDDDYCSDTHNCDYNRYIDSLNVQMDSLKRIYGEDNITLKMVSTRLGCDGTEYVADNIMDYMYCYSDTFTTQQVARMKHVMNYGSLIPGPKLSSSSSSVKTRTSTETTFVPKISSCPNIPRPVTTRGKDNMPLLKVEKKYSIE